MHKRMSCTIISKITSNEAVNVRGFIIAHHVANTPKQTYGLRCLHTNHSWNFIERFITVGSQSSHFKIAWSAKSPVTNLSTSQTFNARTMWSESTCVTILRHYHI